MERPLWWALGVYRLLALGYALLRFALGQEHYRLPAVGWVFLAVLTAWTLLTTPLFRRPERCRWWLLGTDLALGTGGVLLTMVAAHPEAVARGLITLPTVWAASAVLGFAIKGGWQWGAGSALLVGLSNVVERGELVEKVMHNAVLMLLAGIAIGYVVALARTGERALARALRIEAATRERERLARDIHDGVLQVLSLVQRRGVEAGGEAAELGRLAGEQESALRMLVSGALGRPDGASGGGGEGQLCGGGLGDDLLDGADGVPGQRDVAAALAGLTGPRVTVAVPGAPVPLPRPAADELVAAVGAALDNVWAHAGPQARAWILVEDEGGEVVVGVRDDGPGIPEGRLAEAEAEGRLGVAQSIRGRMRDLGGGVEIVSLPGQGTEIEFRVPGAGRG